MKKYEYPHDIDFKKKSLCNFIMSDPDADPDFSRGSDSGQLTPDPRTCL